MYISRVVAKQRATELNQVYKRNRGVIVRRVGEEAILIPSWRSDDDLGYLYRLNPVGAFVWERIDGERTVAELASAVCREFAASLTDVENDLCQFLSQLETIGAAKMLEQSERCKRPRRIH